jgi:mRNA interferase RelE/StbE
MNNPYAIGFKPNALNQLRRLDKGVIDRILDQLLWLTRNVQQGQHDALTGDWKGCFRICVGNYRIIYTLVEDERLIIVEGVGHRRDV